MALEPVFRETMADIIKVLESLPWDDGQFYVEVANRGSFADGQSFNCYESKGDVIVRLFDLDLMNWKVVEIKVEVEYHIVDIIVDEECAEG